MTTRYCLLPTPIGQLALATRDGRLMEIALPALDGTAVVRPGWVRDDDVLPEARAALAGWFAGERDDLDLDLDVASGTAFQRAVWDALDRIPLGETRTYGEIAASVGEPGAARAVGAACGANPLPIVRPCHRVVAAGGRLGGFGGGLAQKRWLLAREGVAAGDPALF